MSLTVSINQPAYLPWLGYIHRIAVSDLHIVLDHVQFEKNSFVNRNRILTKDGPVWLTIPLATKGKFGELPINGVEISDSFQWESKHFKALYHTYHRLEFFKNYSRQLEEKIYSNHWQKLIDVLIESNKLILGWFDVQTEQIYSSSLDPTAAKSDLVLELCIKVGATQYLSGPFGRDYLDLESFKNAGIDVKFHDFIHPVYEQSSNGFIPNLSCLDLLFRFGPDSTKILGSTVNE